MTASTTTDLDGVSIDPQVVVLPLFVDSLAAGWHDGRGYVSLGVTLRRPRIARNESAWSASSVIVVEAGEQMTRFANQLSVFLAHPS